MRYIKEAERLSYIYVPVGFDPSKYPGPIADHPDAARWLLNSIYFNRLLRNFSEDDPVNLNAKLLGRVMGDINKVRPIRQALEENRLIRCDRSYVKGHKSFSFTLGPALKGIIWERYRSESKVFTGASGLSGNTSATPPASKSPSMITWRSGRDSWKSLPTSTSIAWIFPRKPRSNWPSTRSR